MLYMIMKLNWLIQAVLVCKLGKKILQFLCNWSNCKLASFAYKCAFHHMLWAFLASVKYLRCIKFKKCDHLGFRCEYIMQIKMWNVGYGPNLHIVVRCLVQKPDVMKINEYDFWIQHTQNTPKWLKIVRQLFWCYPVLMSTNKAKNQTSFFPK